MADVTIVGGGISGLSCAFFLKHNRPDLTVNLLECSPVVGGRLRTLEHSGYQIECGPDSFIAPGPALRELIRLRGLKTRSIRQGQGVYLSDGGSLRRLGEGMHLGLPGLPWTALWSESLSPWGRLRVALDGQVPVPEGEMHGLGKTVRTRLETEASKQIVSPLSAGVFSLDSLDADASDNFPHVAVYRNEEDGDFLTFEGGMQSLVQSLEAAVGDWIHKDFEVVEILSSQGGWEVRCQHGSVWSSRELVLALPLSASLRLLVELGSFPCGSGACVYFGFADGKVGPLPADGYGFVSRDLSERPVVACSWAEQGEKMLVRCFLRDFDAGLSDEALVKVAWQGLSPMFTLGDPEMQWVERYPCAFPQVTLGDLPRLVEWNEQVKARQGLHWSGPAFGMAGIPGCVAWGRQTARTLLKRLS